MSHVVSFGSCQVQYGFKRVTAVATGFVLIEFEHIASSDFALRITLDTYFSSVPLTAIASHESLCFAYLSDIIVLRLVIADHSDVCTNILAFHSSCL